MGDDVTSKGIVTFSDLNEDLTTGQAFRQIGHVSHNDAPSFGTSTSASPLLPVIPVFIKVHIRPAGQ